MAYLAKDYGLAMRVIGWSAINNKQDQGFPACDYDALDSYQLDPRCKSSWYAQLLRELPAGLNEWAVHPGLDNQELLALEPAGRHERQSDFDFWISQQAKEIIREEGIILLDYRGLQAAWNASRFELKARD